MEQFFASVRKQFGALSQGQVDGFNAILTATEAMPKAYRAYVLATAWHETAKTMQPIEEYGHGAGRPYGVIAGPYGKTYYGRGYVQLTWESNYVKATKRLREIGVIGADIDLERNPELAMRPDIAAGILVHGMGEGWFTGKKLDDFSDYLHMRTIVNGYDQAAAIAAYANWFETALSAMPSPSPTIAPPEVVTVQGAPVSPKPVSPPAPQKTAIQPYTMGPIAALFRILALLLKGFAK